MLIPRSRLEHNEHLALAPYATFADMSRGRSHLEPQSLYRTCFQKDRDRVIHTSAFRRLEYKTQVFVNFQGDYYRTRLTHTLEVAQVAKAITRALGLNEDLAETVALAHDLGHPPFGHAGEQALNTLAYDDGGFDHNKQALRVVTRLERRYPAFDGLNLSWETLEGIMKHEIDPEVAGSKWDPEHQPTLEAQIVDLADSIAYNVHDLDDGLRSTHIRPETLSEVTLVRQTLDTLQIRPETLHHNQNRYQLTRELLGILIQNVIKATHQALEAHHIQSLQDVRNAPYKLATFSSDMQTMTAELKAFLYRNLYFHYRQIRMARKAQHVLTQLFEAYAAEPRMLPFDIQTQIESIGLIRAVTDYLAGMTDRFAGDEHKRLFDPHALT